MWYGTDGLKDTADFWMMCFVANLVHGNLDKSVLIHGFVTTILKHKLS
jgi:hypothetical protein